MNKKQVNELLKNRIGYSNDDDIEFYRKAYLKIIKKPTEEDFYNSMINWFFDGNAPYYNSWLKKNWSDD